jgi:very-short-patch-repair endonuclease
VHAATRVAATAARQHGLVTTAQLRAAGIAPDTITAWVRCGRLHRVHRCVYAVGHRALGDKGWLLAAVLAVGADAAVSHLSAGRLWGVVRDRINVPRSAVDVISPRRVRRRPDIRTHYAPVLDRADRMLFGRIPVTTPERTLLDLAGLLPEDRLRRAVRQAEVERLVNRRDLQFQLSRAPAGCRGAGRLAAVIAIGPAPTRSELEDRTLDLLQRNGFPRPQVNVRVRTLRRSFEVDFLFCDLRLVVEADGDRYHGTRLAREADAQRQADLEAAGYRVVRLNWRQVTREEDETVRRLRRVVADQAPS